MAKSGKKTFNLGNTVNGASQNAAEFAWEVVSESPANNTSTVSWTLTWYAFTYGYINSSAQKSYRVTVNGKDYTGAANIGIANNSSRILASGSTVITHDADGTKTFDFEVYMTIQITYNGKYYGQLYGTGTGTLDPLVRPSVPSCITWPEHTQNVGEFGDEISIHMNRQSSVLTHTVRYQFGTRSGTIATGVETGTKWVIPLSLMDLIPDALKGSGTIYVDTYNGDTKVGTNSCGFTATVPASVKPTCSMTLEDITGVDDIYGSPVQHLSKIKIKASAQPAYSSPIKSYKITAEGVTYTSDEATTGLLSSAGNSPVVVTVTDARGRTGTASYTMRVHAYSPPHISKLTVHRCDVNGVEDAQGEFIEASFAATITSLTDKNRATFTLRYKKSTETEWQSMPMPWIPVETYEIDTSLCFEAAGDSSYDVEVIVADSHNTGIRRTSASTAFTIINWGADGKSMAVGKVAEKPGTFEVGLDAEFNGVTIQKGNSYCFSSIGEADTDGFILMAKITVTATNADTPMTFVFSRRKAAAPMTVHICFKATDDTTPELESIRYEGSNYGAFLHQSSGSVWDLYVQKVSKSDTVTLVRWFTSYRQMKRVSVTFPGTLVSTVANPYYRATPLVAQSIIDCIMPVGFILTLYSHADPNSMYPGTTWERIVNRFLWGCDENGDIGVTGGEKTHTLTAAEMPAHNHGGTYTNAGTARTHAWLASGGSAMGYDTVSAGSGQAHNNMPPYIQVSIWRRTA
jgi:hypothetical protein